MLHIDYSPAIAFAFFLLNRPYSMWIYALEYFTDLLICFAISIRVELSF